MSRITLATLQKIAHLSGLELTTETEKKWEEDLNQIFTWIDQMQEVNINSISPLVNNIETNSILCDDTPQKILNTEEVLKNAPNAQYGHFAVHKVVE